MLIVVLSRKLQLCQATVMHLGTTFRYRRINLRCCESFLSPSIASAIITLSIAITRLNTWEISAEFPFVWLRLVLLLTGHFQENGDEGEPWSKTRSSIRPPIPDQAKMKERKQGERRINGLLFTFLSLYTQTPVSSNLTGVGRSRRRMVINKAGN